MAVHYALEITYEVHFDWPHALVNSKKTAEVGKIVTRIHDSGMFETDFEAVEPPE